MELELLGEFVAPKIIFAVALIFYFTVWSFDSLVVKEALIAHVIDRGNRNLDQNLDQLQFNSSESA